MKKLSIIIPVLNEEKAIIKILKTLEKVVLIKTIKLYFCLDYVFNFYENSSHRETCFVGTNLSERLLRKNHDVYSLIKLK